MKKLIAAASILLAFTAGASLVSADDKGKSGEEIFKQNCASCHPNGGNIINAQKTLSKKDREANKVKSVDDIVKLMRNPGPGMTKFDKNTISDKDAKKVSEYILKTFK